MKTTIDNSEM